MNKSLLQAWAQSRRLADICWRELNVLIKNKKLFYLIFILFDIVWHQILPPLHVHPCLHFKAEVLGTLLGTYRDVPPGGMGILHGDSPGKLPPFCPQSSCFMCPCPCGSWTSDPAVCSGTSVSLERNYRECLWKGKCSVMSLDQLIFHLKTGQNESYFSLQSLFSCQ